MKAAEESGFAKVNDKNMFSGSKGNIKRDTASVGLEGRSNPIVNNNEEEIKEDTLKAKSEHRIGSGTIVEGGSSK